LTKHKLNTLQASVAFVLDALGSMTGEFSRGHVQSVLIASLFLPFSLMMTVKWIFGALLKSTENI
jgi:hypothetical protein